MGNFDHWGMAPAGTVEKAPVIETGPGTPPAPFAGQGGGGAPVSQLLRVAAVPLPRYQPIPTAIYFNVGGAPVATAVVQAGIAIPDADVLVPVGSIGTLESVIFGVDALLTTSDLRFTVLLNGAPMSGFSRIRIFPGNAARVTNAFDVKVDLPDGAHLQVTFENNDGGTYQVGAELSGFTYTQGAARRWLQVGE